MVRGQGRSTGEVPVQRGSGLPARADLFQSLLATHRGKLSDWPTRATGSAVSPRAEHPVECSAVLVLRCCSRFPVELSDLLIHVLIIVTVTGGLGARETGALEYTTRHPCTLSNTSCGDGWCNTHGTLAHFRSTSWQKATCSSRRECGPAVPSGPKRSRGPERSQALTNEAMELPSQVMNR